MIMRCHKKNSPEWNMFCCKPPLFGSLRMYTAEKLIFIVARQWAEWLATPTNRVGWKSTGLWDRWYVTRWLQVIITGSERVSGAALCMWIAWTDVHTCNASLHVSVVTAHHHSYTNPFVCTAAFFCFVVFLTSPPTSRLLVNLLP